MEDLSIVQVNKRNWHNRNWHLPNVVFIAQIVDFMAIINRSVQVNKSLNCLVIHLHQRTPNGTGTAL
eukprot:scaffold471045_cov19-Prasinocladus_malaysianus.AAC.1